jgi:hypothetical protein
VAASCRRFRVAVVVVGMALSAILIRAVDPAQGHSAAAS